MSDFWENIRRLFQSAEDSTPSQPVIHELIERSEQEQTDYGSWKETLVCRRLQDWLHDQYAIFQVAPRDIDEGLDFLDTPSSKGFVIYFHKTRYSRRDVAHFFDWLREQVLKLGYRTQISDTRTFNRPQWVETIERHYLKPRPQFNQAGPFPQQYGNITIEMELRDDRAHQLRFRATHYQDRLYTQALEFPELMQEILLHRG